MCKACETKDSPELARIYRAWIPLDTATHLIVAWTCSGGGLVADASNELTAHRYARIFRAHGHVNVRVMLNNPESSKEIHKQCTSVIEGMLNG